MLVTASVLQPSLSLRSKTFIKSIPSLSLSSPSPSLCLLRCHTELIALFHTADPLAFALFFTYKHSQDPHVSKSHTIPQGRGRVFDLFRAKAHPKDGVGKFTQSSVRGRKIRFDWGVVTETHMSFDSRGNWLIEQYKNKLDRKQDFTPLMLISEYLVDTAFIH